MDEMTRAGYDYRQHDRLWQRVAPSLTPWPEGEVLPGAASGQGMSVPSGGASGLLPGTAPGPGTAGGAGMAAGMGNPSQDAGASPSTAAEESLPGAVGDPCCMGSAARDDLAVLEGFRDQELADRRYYQAMQRTAPAAARSVLRELAARKQAHGRYLAALSYLITGQCRQEVLDCQRIYVGTWCPALRQRYHEEACAGFNYLRAADGTPDPCLQKAYRRLSEESYQQAELLTELLERALSSPCARPGMGV